MEVRESEQLRMRVVAHLVREAQCECVRVVRMVLRMCTMVGIKLGWTTGVRACAQQDAFRLPYKGVDLPPLTRTTVSLLL